MENRENILKIQKELQGITLINEKFEYKDDEFKTLPWLNMSQGIGKCLQNIIKEILTMESRTLTLEMRVDDLTKRVEDLEDRAEQTDLDIESLENTTGDDLPNSIKQLEDRIKRLESRHNINNNEQEDNKTEEEIEDDE